MKRTVLIRGGSASLHFSCGVRRFGSVAAGYPLVVEVRPEGRRNRVFLWRTLRALPSRIFRWRLSA